MVLCLFHQIGVVFGSTVTSKFSQDALPYAAVVTAVRQPSVINDFNFTRRLSPIHSGVRSNLSMAMCGSINTDMAQGKEYVNGGIGRDEEKKEKGIPVYIMLPLDSVTCNHKVNRRKAMNASLMALKSAGVEGLIINVWWGLVEREKPGEYNWGGYSELLDMAKRLGFKVIATMSFHQCAGNIGIHLPEWVVEEINSDPELAYTDELGRRNFGYISLGCDSLPLLKGRTPVQCYSDFLKSFRDKFDHLLCDTITEIQVGMGPAGKLRYPSSIGQNGIAAFQCNGKYMLASLKAAVESMGKPEWAALTGSADTISGPYGEFFLSWYSQMLLNHVERIIQSAKSAFENTLVKISVEGIHWHYGTISHTPELTAGSYNSYLPIANMLGRHGAVFNSTCIEMRDCEQSLNATFKLAKLRRYDECAQEQIMQDGEDEWGMTAFTYLTMSPDMFRPDNWSRFVMFVKRMRQGKDANCLFRRKPL